jgi:hypothetical protein
MTAARSLYGSLRKSRGSRNMPVLVVPLLVGIPVVIGGGYVLYRIIGG